MTRVGTLAQNNLTLFHTLNTLSRVQDLQIQVASDKKSQDYAGISKDALRLVSLEVTRLEITQFTSNITTGEQRLQLLDLSVTSIEEVSRDFRGVLDTALNGPDALGSNLVQLAADRLAMVADLLNSRDGARFLFGGARVDRPPVVLSPPGYSSVSLIEADGVTVDSTYYEADYTQVQGNTLPFAQGSFYQQIYFDKNGVLPVGPLPADLDNPTLSEFVAEDPALWQYYVDRLDSAALLANPKLDYYQGDTQATIVRADDDLDVSFDVRADLTAFQQILSALDAVANLPDGDTGDPFQRAVVAKARNMLNAALDTLNGSGIDTLDQLRIELSRARDNLSFARERHESLSAYAEGVIHDIEHIDRNEVVVRLQGNQQVLEASYASLARLQSLTLLDFI